ncbi:cytochrome P450 [Pseudooceanicola nitratireducens]|uniref:cytochrome P450 n=1 Tax=Pseudooceanicola nitratireducens TaxID=517719 RepID=UPI001C9378B4|nr:cytochrome P450 [Pseudooceanicola nitratireducens]MBY6158650.1 cytochrome P450 [Pseudooceanicola nitratireducens]
MTLNQSPTDPAFVQNPYPVYARARAAAPLQFWEDYGMMAAFSHEAVQTLLKDRRFGREIPAELARPHPSHLAPFYAIDDHSMLELDGDTHKRLRGLVLRAFTSRRIAALGPEIAALSHQLIDSFPSKDFDLLTHFAAPLPVRIIARLLGVPEEMSPDLLRWSNAMVAMYQARRDRAVEDAAARAAADFSDFIRSYIETRRTDPRDDLITQLIAAEEDGTRLSTDEMIATCILLLNAGHEATVHTIGNGMARLLSAPLRARLATHCAPAAIAATTEEILRHDPPLHMFTRYAYEEVTLFGHTFRRGDQVALMLAAANRDPAAWTDPETFDPTRPVKTNSAFGAGAHFCIGAPLARLELTTALPILAARCPQMQLAAPPEYGDTYHFHGLTALRVRV